MREISLALSSLLLISCVSESPQDSSIEAARARKSGPVHTERSSGGGLILRSTLPAVLTDCQKVAGATCTDADHDGLTDGWESLVLDRLRPLVRFDEKESALSDSFAVLASVGRVMPLGGPKVHVFIMLGYSRDYGQCGFTAHNGDSERVALELQLIGGGDAQVMQVYTAAHEGEATDRSQVFGSSKLGSLTYANDAQTGEPRWVVYSSRNKHATYGLQALCEGSYVWCLSDACAANGVSNPKDYEALFPTVNVGEDWARLVDDLSSVGFGGESVWSGQPFCGGLGGSGCAASVRSKMTSDPF
jgi:hypothetical protein